MSRRALRPSIRASSSEARLAPVRAARKLAVRRLGLVSYQEALEWQKRLVDDRRAGAIPDTLLLLEHPHVLTIGVRGGGRSNIVAPLDRLQRLGVAVHETGRGGDVTYHGPGQLVGYPILDLRPDRQDVHRYVRDLEEVLIRVCGDLGVAAYRVPGLTGVWVAPPELRRTFAAADRHLQPTDGGAGQGPAPWKVAAIGVRIARWVTCHGFALNVNTELSFFDLIVPCGIQDKGVTSLQRVLRAPVDMDALQTRVVARFLEVFQADEVPLDPGGGA